MATQAHCAYCFESLVASLEKRPALSLQDVQTLWEKYTSPITTTSELADETAAEEEDQANATLAPTDPAISRILASPNSSATSSPLPSTCSTPSLATSQSSSATTLPSDDDVNQAEHPLFVTWNTLSHPSSSSSSSSSSPDRRLRGCIGTFEALPLTTGLSSYALTSAFDDTRFPPITSRELATLEVAVTLLTDFEPAAHALDWDVGTHGLRISFSDKGRRYGSTYLPDVAKEQGWSKEEALVSLMRKAGWGGRKAEWKKVDLRVVRYQGRKVSLGYDEWRAWREWVGEEMDDQ